MNVDATTFLRGDCRRLEWISMQDYHVLRASLICDGRSLPLLSKVVPSSKQNNVLIQKEFLDELAEAIDPDKKVIIITDAGFQANWFQHVKMLGWSFIGRVRGNVKFRLQNMGEKWLHLSDMEGKNRPEISRLAHNCPSLGLSGFRRRR